VVEAEAVEVGVVEEGARQVELVKVDLDRGEVAQELLLLGAPEIRGHGALAGVAVDGDADVGLELVDGDGKVAGVVGSGEFLFPTEVLGGGNAPNTARAGSGGALILFGDRKIAQELLVTCPPLLEVFAGM